MLINSTTIQFARNAQKVNHFDAHAAPSKHYRAEELMEFVPFVFGRTMGKTKTTPT